MAHLRYSERFELAQAKINDIKRTSADAQDFHAKVKELCAKTYGKENYEVYSDVLSEMGEMGLSFQFIKRMKSMGHANTNMVDMDDVDDEAPAAIADTEELPAAIVEPETEEEEDSHYNDVAQEEEEEEVYHESKFMNFEQFTKVNESSSVAPKKDNFYAKYWIEALTSAFGKTVIDKVKTVKPLYGGGNIVAIGYEVQVPNNRNVTSLILEGIAINGVFVNPSIILLKGDVAMMHGALDVHYYFRDGFDKNIQDVIAAMQSKIEKSVRESKSADNKKKSLNL